MAEKSRDAFRTISEVAEWLDVPTHVLRFWESRFSQIKPVKRAGGRRYYRPSDMRVIGGVKVLLHDQGMTIRGVQKLFREEGIKHVSGFAPPLFGEEEEEDVVEAAALDEGALEQAVRPAARATRDAEPAPVGTAEPTPREETPVAEADDDVPPLFRSAARSAPRPAPPVETPADEPAEAETALAEPEPEPEPEAPAPAIPPTPDVPETDSPDDAPEHEKGPGVAARLRLVDQGTLARHRDTLREAAEQLRALLDRVS